MEITNRINLGQKFIRIKRTWFRATLRSQLRRHHIHRLPSMLVIGNQRMGPKEIDGRQWKMSIELHADWL